MIFVTLLASCSVIAGCAARKPWVLAQGQHPQSFERRVTVEAQGRLLLFLPAGFDRSGATRYPLLIFLHGAGEAGEDLEKLKVLGPPRIVASRADFPFIVASPQARNSIERFDPVVLNAMLDELLEQLPIDADRVYLTGVSMGGMWSYAWASQHPDRFAAIAPVCGTWDPADACRFKDVPVWSFHGAKDDVVPLAGDQATIEAIKACSNQACSRSGAGATRRRAHMRGASAASGATRALLRCDSPDCHSVATRGHRSGDGSTLMEGA